MRKLYRSCYNAIFPFASGQETFFPTYSVYNPSYSFSETDALARCSLGDLSTHVVKKKAHLLS